MSNLTHEQQLEAIAWSMTLILTKAQFRALRDYMWDQEIDTDDYRSETVRNHRDEPPTNLITMWSA